MTAPRHAYAAILFAALLNAKAYSFAPDFCFNNGRIRANAIRQRRPQTWSPVQRASLPTSVEEGPRKPELTKGQRDEIDALVAQRADARRCGDYNLADSIRAEIEACTERFAAPGYQIQLRDIPRKDGGGSTWDVVPQLRESIERSEMGESVLQLSHIALGLAIVSSEQDVALDLQVLEDIVLLSLARLEATGAAELRGRKAADAAFWFALSGASSPNAAKLLHSLTLIAIEELERFGNKSSCRAKDVMHIVERLYATGLTGYLSKRLSDVAADCLVDKEFRGRNTSTNSDIIDLLRSHEFDLHSDRSLLWIWRFSIRQKKQRSFLRGATEQYARYNNGSREMSSSRMEETDYKWSELFDDPSRPLVIDIGCGYGISLHGLSTLQEKDLAVSTELDIEWEHCNFLGIDLSRTAIGFANALALRWEVNRRLAYVVGSAEDVLQAVLDTYPGNVCLAMVQFPTPYKLQKVSTSNESAEGENDIEEAKGNSQLPKHPYSDFMVTRNLLLITRETLSASRGKLIMQSNVEDVAVYMRDIAEESGFTAVSLSNPITSFDEVKARIPQRTKEYIKTGESVPRALGKGWARDALLPRRGATETEIACLLERTPVHRCVLICS